MTGLLEKIQIETNKLSSQERAFLANRLLSSLDGEEFLESIKFYENCRLGLGKRFCYLLH